MRLSVNEETRGNQEQKSAVACLAERAGRLKVKERKEMERDGNGSREGGSGREKDGRREQETEMREETKGREGKWPSLKANQRNDSPLPAS